MNMQDNAGLTLEQRRRISEAQRYVDEHRREIDAAVEVAQDVPDSEMPHKTIDRAADAVSRSAASIVDPVVEQIKEASLDRIRPRILEQIRPAVTKAFTPPSLEQLGFRLPPMPRFEMPELRVATPDLKIDLPITQFVAPVMPAVDQLGFQPPTIPAFGPDVSVVLPSMKMDLPAMEWLPPSLEQLGITTFDPKLTMPPLEALKQAHSWQSVVPRIDLSAFTRVRDVAASLSALRLPDLIPDWSEQMAPAFRIIEDLRSTVGSLLDNWKTLADFGHKLARFGLVAALGAREAAINGETEDVEWFARAWLGIKQVTPDVLEAVVAALLDWSVEAAGDVIKNLKRLVKRHRRGHRLIGETQLHGRTFDSLHREIKQPGGTVVELGAQVAAPTLDFTGYGFTDRRSVALLDGLDAIEKEIVFARFATIDTGMTWGNAAQDCGYPATKGESVRRKVKRIAQRIDPQAS